MAVCEAEEGAGRGTLALVGDLAHSAAASMATLTRDAVLGRPGGYRAGVSYLIVCQAEGRTTGAPGVCTKQTRRSLTRPP